MSTERTDGQQVTWAELNKCKLPKKWKRINLHIWNCSFSCFDQFTIILWWHSHPHAPFPGLCSARTHLTTKPRYGNVFGHLQLWHSSTNSSQHSEGHFFIPNQTIKTHQAEPSRRIAHATHQSGEPKCFGKWNQPVGRREQRSLTRSGMKQEGRPLWSQPKQMERGG